MDYDAGGSSVAGVGVRRALAWALTRGNPGAVGAGGGRAFLAAPRLVVIHSRSDGVTGEGTR